MLTKTERFALRISPQNRAYLDRLSNERNQKESKRH